MLHLIFPIYYFKLKIKLASINEDGNKEIYLKRQKKKEIRKYNNNIDAGPHFSYIREN